MDVRWMLMMVLAAGACDDFALVSRSRGQPRSDWLPVASRRSDGGLAQPSSPDRNRGDTARARVDLSLRPDTASPIAPGDVTAGQAHSLVYLQGATVLDMRGQVLGLAAYQQAHIEDAYLETFG